MATIGGRSFDVRDRFPRGTEIAVGKRVGRVIGHADDVPMLLVRWVGGRVCDWVKVEEAVYAYGDGADAPRPSEGEDCPATN